MSQFFKPFQLTSGYVKSVVLFLIVVFPVFCYSQDVDTINQPVFNHAALCAKNLSKTAAFYTDVMELKVIPHPFSDTLHVWLKIGNGLALHIIQGDCPQAVHNISIHLCFSVTNLGIFMKHLDALKIKYGGWNGEPKKVQLRPDGVHQIYLQDPDGFWVEVNDAK